MSQSADMLQPQATPASHVRHRIAQDNQYVELHEHMQELMRLRNQPGVSSQGLRIRQCATLAAELLCSLVFLSSFCPRRGSGPAARCAVARSMIQPKNGFRVDHGSFHLFRHERITSLTNTHPTINGEHLSCNPARRRIGQGHNPGGNFFRHPTAS